MGKIKERKGVCDKEKKQKYKDYIGQVQISTNNK